MQTESKKDFDQKYDALTDDLENLKQRFFAFTKTYLI